MRKSGIALALGLIAGAAGLDAQAATAPAAALEQRYDEILQLSSPEAVQSKLAELFAANPEDPALQPVLARMLEVAELVIPPPASTAPGAADGGSQRDIQDAGIEPY